MVLLPCSSLRTIKFRERARIFRRKYSHTQLHVADLSSARVVCDLVPLIWHSTLAPNIHLKIFGLMWNHVFSASTFVWLIAQNFPVHFFFRIRASRRQKVVDQLFKHGRILSSIETKKNWLFSIYFAQRNETFLQVSPQNVCEKYDVDNWCCFPIQATRRGWYATQNLSELWNNNLNARKKRKHTQYLRPIGEEIGVQLAFK